MPEWSEKAAAAALKSASAANRRRRLRTYERAGTRLVTEDGKSLFDACSNDYLGLSQHPALRARAAEWTERYGTGATASRLVCGTTPAHVAVEAKLAAFKGKEAALVFGTGYQANAAVLPALFELSGAGKPVVFTDRLNHASLHMGCAAAGVRQLRYQHNDLEHLESLLKEHGEGPRFIVTESVFSMDGDRTDVAALAALARHYDALVYIDEAHATGVVGPEGRGLAALVPDSGFVVMGTLGKALGAAGAYVAASRTMIEWLVNRCGGFIYSTAPSPPVLGAVDAALDLVPGMNAERARLATISDTLRGALAARGYDTLGSTTQIVPALCGAEAAAIEAAGLLEERGVLAIAIRPPTVPTGTSRIRFSLSAALTDADMGILLDAVAALPAR